MSSILLVTSSPRGAESLSSKVAIDLANSLSAKNNGETVVHRDLGANPIPHLDTVATSAIRKPADARTAEEAAAADYSDTLVRELLAADTLVIATGLINFGIYSTLKSWIDNVARAGQTFTYTAEGRRVSPPARRSISSCPRVVFIPKALLRPWITPFPT